MIKMIKIPKIIVSEIHLAVDYKNNFYSFMKINGEWHQDKIDWKGEI